MNPERKQITPDFDIEDYIDTRYFSLLNQLPNNLAARHIKYVEEMHMTEEETMDYLTSIAEARQEAMTQYGISDERLAKLPNEVRKEFFKQLQSTILNNPQNYLGTGITAKVKKYQLSTEELFFDLAIKYVVTPTPTTLTAEQEHNATLEIERLKVVEKAELIYPKRSKYIRVPHPYFFLHTKEIDSYGMEFIDGYTMEQIANDLAPQEYLIQISKSPLASLPENERNGYIERFFETMHQICLHGDIKLRNIMLSREGVIYVIDFGQSVMMHNIPGGNNERVENLKSDEVKSVQIMVRNILQKAQKIARIAD